MGDTYNPQDGSRFIYELSRSITTKGQDMVHSFQGGKRKPMTRSKSTKSRRKKYRYNKYASFYKKQQSYKFNTRKRK
jgi:hypothetical protein